MREFSPRPRGGGIFDTVLSGTAAWAGTGGGPGEIQQDVMVLPNFVDTYTLSAYVGWEDTRASSASVGSIGLLVGGVAVSGQASVCTPAQGNWALCTYTYTTSAQDFGQTLTIDLKSGSVPQAAFDEVTLSDTSTPEPGTFVLLGLGLLVARRFCRREN
jgi:MYXO-CTERM domain-containing protein